MSKFNSKKPNVNTPNTTNLAGGKAFKQSMPLELVSFLLTSFMANTFYEKEAAARERLENLVGGQKDLRFAAQAIVYARREFGMRSVSHYGAATLAPLISGQPWAKDFYEAMVQRPDDMLETASIIFARGGKLPASMKKGFAAAFDRFNAYHLAKYRGEGKGLKMVDMVNYVHPKPTEANREALEALMAGTLKNTYTWEAQLSAAGGDDGKKKEVWAELIGSGKIGQFALLRNLRNIVMQSPEAIRPAVALLTDRTRIKRSLILPFRYITAFRELEKIGPVVSSEAVRHAMLGVASALDISCDNVPKFEGSTLVVLDVSSSMTSAMHTKFDATKTPAAIGALFSAVMMKAWNCDFMTFDGTARYVQYNPADSAVGIITRLHFTGGSTNFHSVFQTANKAYDRIILLSDMQGWVGNNAPVESFRAYKKKYNCEPVVYSFDLQNYGTMQFPESKVFCLAGFSDKIFDIMGMLEGGGVASLVKTVADLEFSTYLEPEKGKIFIDTTERYADPLADESYITGPKEE